MGYLDLNWNKKEKKMKKIILVLFAIASLTIIALPALAQDGAVETTKAKEKVNKPKSPVIEVTLVGKITTMEKTNKKGKTKKVYLLTDAEGETTYLPKSKKQKENAEPAPVIILDNFLNIDVKVLGKGIEKEKKGKKKIKMETITSIEKLGKD